MRTMGTMTTIICSDVLTVHHFSKKLKLLVRNREIFSTMTKKLSSVPVVEISAGNMEKNTSYTNAIIVVQKQLFIALTVFITVTIAITNIRTTLLKNAIAI